MSLKIPNSNELNNIELLKSFDKSIYFDNTLNILFLLIWFKSISSLENIWKSNINQLITLLKKLNLYYKIEPNYVYVSKNNYLVSNIEKLKDNLVFWKILWFPECCCNAYDWFGWISEKNYFEYFVSMNLKSNRGKYKLLTFFNWEWKLFFHIPCSFSCLETYKKADFIYKNYSLISDYKHCLNFDKFIILENLVYIRLLKNKIVSCWTFIPESEDSLVFKDLENWNYVDILDKSIIFLWNKSYEYKDRFLTFYF